LIEELETISFAGTTKVIGSIPKFNTLRKKTVRSTKMFLPAQGS